MSDLDKFIKETHAEVMKTPLSEFLKEADEIGYSFFCKDIVKKVIISRLHKQGKLGDNNG